MYRSTATPKHPRALRRRRRTKARAGTGGAARRGARRHPEATKSYTYDSQGRTRTITLLVQGEPAALVSTIDYDAQGRVKKITYPGPVDTQPFAVLYDHDDHGHVTAVRDAITKAPLKYWTLEDVDGAGRTTMERFGNNAVTVRGYFADKQRLKSIATHGNNLLAPIQSLSYEYDDKLNLTKRRDATQAKEKAERFRYDPLDRLTCAYFADKAEPKAPCAQVFTYNANGNLTSKTGVGTLAYTDLAHPHAVTAAGGDTFTYDVVGNQRTRPGATIDYTPFDLPKTIT